MISRDAQEHCTIEPHPQMACMVQQMQHTGIFLAVLCSLGSLGQDTLQHQLKGPCNRQTAHAVDECVWRRDGGHTLLGLSRQHGHHELSITEFGRFIRPAHIMQHSRPQQCAPEGVQCCPWRGAPGSAVCPGWAMTLLSKNAAEGSNWCIVWAHQSLHPAQQVGQVPWPQQTAAQDPAPLLLAHVVAL